MTAYPDDPRLGDVVRFRTNKVDRHDHIGRVVREADATGRLQVEMVYIPARTTVRNFTVHLDDTTIVKRKGE